jgi:hypothetical protein
MNQFDRITERRASPGPAVPVSIRAEPCSAHQTDAHRTPSMPEAFRAKATKPSPPSSILHPSYLQPIISRLPSLPAVIRFSQFPGLPSGG